MAQGPVRVTVPAGGSATPVLVMTTAHRASRRSAVMRARWCFAERPTSQVEALTADGDLVDNRIVRLSAADYATARETFRRVFAA